MGQFALVNVLVLTEKIAGDCVLQKRVPNRFQSFKVDGIIAIAHCERLKDEGRTGSWVGIQLRIFLAAKFNECYGAGLIVAANVRLALQSILAKGLQVYPLQLQDMDALYSYSLSTAMHYRL